MSIEDNYENSENLQMDILDKFPAFIVDNKENGYTFFSWEDEEWLREIPSDRAFVIDYDGLSNNSDPFLFQLTYKGNRSVQANRSLWDLPIFKKEIYEELVEKGLAIVKEVASGDDKIAFSSFSKEAELDDKTYVVTYMAANRYLANISMRDNYVKRIRQRYSKLKKGKN